MSVLTRISALIATASILLLTFNSPLASARPDPVPPVTGVPTSVAPGHCSLMRIGTQLIRCDNLTGAGVPAPLFIPPLVFQA